MADWFLLFYHRKPSYLPIGDIYKNSNNLDRTLQSSCNKIGFIWKTLPIVCKFDSKYMPVNKIHFFARFLWDNISFASS